MFDVDLIRKDFAMISNNPDLIYFDSSATSFKPNCVIAAVTNCYEHLTSNIHRGDYDISVEVSRLYDETRKVVSDFIKANNPKSIIFTSGATESLNMVAYCYGLKNLKQGDVILTSLVEHASNILPLFNIAKITGAKIEYIPLNEDGTFNLENYQKCFENNNVKLVALTHISNVLGYIYPIKEIVSIAHQNGAVVSADGAQAVPHISVDVSDSDIDFLSFSSHKMCGPSGVGVLYGKYELLQSLDPLFFGGGSNARFDLDQSLILKQTPEKFESGTPNIEGVLGLKAAIEYLQKLGMDSIEKYEQELKDYFLGKLISLDNVTIYNKNCDVGIISFNVKGVFAQDAASYFNSKKIAVRTGNHCAKMLHNIIGATESIRASLYFYNTKAEIDKFIEIIKETTLEKCVDSVL